MTDQQKMGNVIRMVRNANRLDQKKFSSSIGATVSALSNWENGRNFPKIEYLKKISQIYNVPLSYLTKTTKERVTDIVNSLEKQVNFYEQYKELYDLTFKFKLIDDITYFVEEQHSKNNFYTDKDIRDLAIKEIEKKNETKKFEPFNDKNAMWYIQETLERCHREIVNTLKEKNVNEDLIKAYEIEFENFYYPGIHNYDFFCEEE